MSEKTFTVDFITTDAVSNEWKMVLVESGPWEGLVQDHLRALQTRLYDCIDAALDGQLADRFPESKGKRLIVQVDCYDISRAAVEPFIEEFSTGVFTQGDYKDANKINPYVSSIEFVVTFDSIH